MIRDTKLAKEFIEAAAAGNIAVLLYKRDDGSTRAIDMIDLIEKQVERGAVMICEVPESEAQTDVSDTQEEKPRSPGRGGKPKVDHGKIIALHNAGWSGPAIADEMNISIGTVYKHIDAEQKETAEKKEA